MKANSIVVENVRREELFPAEIPEEQVRECELSEEEKRREEERVRRA